MATRTRITFNVFVLDFFNRSVTEEWRKVYTAQTEQKAFRKVDELNHQGITEVRVTRVTTEEVLNTRKN